MLDNDADQDGDWTAPNNNKKAEGVIHAEGMEQNACSTCQETWNNIKSKSSFYYLKMKKPPSFNKRNYMKELDDINITIEMVGKTSENQKR